MKFKKIIVRFDAENLILTEELICDIFFSFNLKRLVRNNDSFRYYKKAAK
ncbi:MAG: hypothetical protein GXP56_00060 [Deltaproteobacteria bacterium]|nr:hypothetical protein [Deltaproteobacteria bacterium]